MNDRLRELAKQRVQPPPADTLQMSREEIARLVYELEIHQEELEIQNEELRRTQVELKDSRDRYVDLYDFAPVGYLTLGANSEIAEANLTACEMLGHERARLIGMRLDLLCDADSREELRRHLNQVFSAGNRSNAELKLATDREFFVLLETCPSTGPGDDSLHCRTVMTDVTLRRQAQRSALEKDERLQSLADALPVLISYLDSELRFQFNNDAHRHWLGLTSEALQGRTIHEALGESFDEECIDYFTDALDGREITFESSLMRADKGLRQVQVTLVPEFGSGGPNPGNGREVRGIHTLCIDITERKIIDEQNSRRRAMASMLDQLSMDERNVYQLLIRGKSNKVIAFDLDIGMRTVERRRRSILNKLEVESLAELLQKLADIQGAVATT